MCNPLRIDFVSAPYAGHLFPQLELARGLRERGITQLRFLSTPEASTAVVAEGFEFTPLLVDVSQQVLSIANTDRRIGSNPLGLLRQLKKNLSLMQQLQSELRAFWKQSPPDLVIADLTVPVAGLLAASLGIAWWSSLPTVCVLDSKDGVPAYLGGWLPSTSIATRGRDAVGRWLTRSFKRTLHRLFRSQMCALGIDSVYRDDGTERIYSPDTILGFAIREFEFPRTWPKALQFVGPMTRSPAAAQAAPQFSAAKPHVLISLGTHVLWAKAGAIEFMQRVAQLMPDYEFHFSEGIPGSQRVQHMDNFHVYGYIPYSDYIQRYQLAIHHAGTGVMYSCLRYGIPALVWPQDYDQFDHAARLTYHGLGCLLKPSGRKQVPQLAATLLRQLAADEQMRGRLENFRKTMDTYSTIDTVVERLTRVSAEAVR